MLYQAIKLGPVSALSKDPNLFISKSNQVDVKHQEQTCNLAVSPVKNDQVTASTQKYKSFTNQHRSFDSAKSTMRGKENKNTGTTISSPSEKLFKVTPPKRRSLNLPLKRDHAVARIDKKKNGYDPYDFDSSSSSEENIQPTAMCPRLSMAILSAPTEKKSFINCQNSTSQLQTPKGKKNLQAKLTKAAPKEDSYEFKKESKKIHPKNVKTSPKFILDSDYDSPPPKKRLKAKMAKSKFTANNSLVRIST